MKLTIATFLFDQPWFWKKKGYEKYKPQAVNALWRMCADNISFPHRFVCFADRPDGIECEVKPQLPKTVMIAPKYGPMEGCFHRLRLYDPELAQSFGTEFILILDLDVVLMRDVTEFLERCMEHDFTALIGSDLGPGRGLVTWYNGSFQLCRAGSRPKFWQDYNSHTFFAQRDAYKMPSGKRPLGTDQAWLTVCAGPGENTVGPDDGCYQYRTLHGKIPDNAQIIFFSGKVNPWHKIVREQTPHVAERWWKYAE